MLLSLLTQTSYHTLALPERVEGHYYLSDPESGDELFTITGEASSTAQDLLVAPHSCWVVKEGALGRLPHGKPAVLESGMLLKAHIGWDLRPAYLFAEEGGKPYAHYARCLVGDDATCVIGSGRDCDIRCTGPHVAERHCILRCKGRAWSVTDCGSSLGTFVNGRRISQGEQTLSPGDVVSVLNQKFIPLPGLLCLNAQGIDPKALKARMKPLGLPKPSSLEPLGKEGAPRYFHRQPRFTDSLSTSNIEVEAPPSPQGQRDDIPALLTYGPAVTSGATMLLAGMNPIMGIGMMAGSVIFPGLTRRHSQKLMQQEEERRRALYTEYLEKVERQLDDIGRQQARVLHERSPEPRKEMARLLDDNRELWSRRPSHADFLWLRLGTGNLPMLADLRFPSEGLSMVDDPLRDQLEQFQQRPRLMRGVPIGFDLSRFYSVGVTGAAKSLRPYAAQLVGQLAAHCGYDDLRLCLIGTPEGELEPLRWLPHTWDARTGKHLTANNLEELERLLPVLDELLAAHDVEGSSASVASTLLVVFADPDLAHTGAVTRLLFDRERKGVHVITLAEHGTGLPSNTDVAIGLSGGKARMVWQDDAGRHTQDLTPDKVTGDTLPKLVSLMANMRLDLPTASAAMPDQVTFLDLFGVQDVNHLNILNRWDNARPMLTLAAPIGIGEDGEVCMLDVHERGDGPHGLVAGTTGSGKSEMLMTYVMSMAVTYSPRDVNFAFIDYKGGGMASAFANLPHTVGVITNLDGSVLARSLSSIEAENLRRQRLFAQVQGSLGMGKIEIKDYQELYREGRVTEPLPHLIIITDEFAELKQQEHEFMDKLISAARIGRSLGVHLILATQQPAGVVDEQIMANTNFRLCLRMTSPQDSQSILHIADAASLTRPGSLYKQVGSVTTRVQSGYSGVDYLPQQDLVANCDVEVLNHLGSTLGRSRLPKARPAKTVSQATAVCRYITEAAAREGLSARKLWMPVLEERIPLGDLRNRYGADDDPWQPSALLGELDDPANQRRMPVRLSLADGRNSIVYGAIGSGKAMALTTVLEDLLTCLTPDQLQVYILDYGDDGFGAFLDAPHVGDVLTADEDEKLRRFLTMLEMEVARRRRVLGGSLVTSPLGGRLREAGECRILVVLDRLSTIQERLDDLDYGALERLIRLLKDGPRWGISFLAVQEGASGVRYKLQECFAQRFVLQMDHDDDYRTLLGKTDGRKPASVRGRGLMRNQDGLYEFQVATPEADVRKLCSELRDGWSGAVARPVRVLPAHVTADLLLPYADGSNPLLLPVGLDTDTLDPALYPFDGRTLHLVFGKPADVSDFLDGLLGLAERGGMDVIRLGPDDVADPDTVVHEMFEDCKRMKAQLDAGQRRGGGHRIIAISSPKRLFERLCEDEKSSLRAILKKARPEWRWTFLVCGTPQEFSSLRYVEEDQAWFKASASTSEGIFLGGGIGSQTVLQVGGGARLHQDVRFPLGFTVLDGMATQVMFLEG